LKTPLTRTLLEQQISEVQKEFNVALGRKDYAACDPLQTKLDALMLKRSDLPTIEELNDEVHRAEQAVATAAEKRDFSGAADAQARLEESKRRLAEALASENGTDSEDENSDDGRNGDGDKFGVQSRAELEQDISELRVNIKKAIESKDFKTASSFQKNLDDREALRKFFPTLVELEAELKEKKAQLDEAIGKKNFVKAGELNKSIDTIEEKVKMEKLKMAQRQLGATDSTEASVIGLDGEMKTFESRSDLESEISATAAAVSKAVAAKQFQKAEELNVYTEKLECLRKVLPTMQEMEQQLRAHRKEFNEAVAKKEFAKADSINKTIENLEKVLEKERSKQPVKKHTTTSVQSNTKAVAPKAKLTPKLPSGTAVAGMVDNDDQSIRSAPVSKTLAKSRDDLSVHSLPAKSSGLQKPSTGAGANKSVSKLRPKKPILGNSNDTVLACLQLMKSKRGDAALIVDDSGSLAGIITDVDCCRRVVAKNVDPASTRVSEVMTESPTCTRMDAPALDALSTMLDNKFRHLPVLDESGAVYGVLDITKTLSESIGKLEVSEVNKTRSTDDVVKQVLGQQNSGDAHALALHALLGQVMTQAFGNQSSTPTLASLLPGKAGTIVLPNTSLRAAGKLMAQHRKAAVVVDDQNMPVGIFSFKDLMNSVAKQMDLDATIISECMVENPETIAAEATVLEGLQFLHDHKIRSLPVCARDGSVLGVLDVLTLMAACGGSSGWRSIFSNAMELGDDDTDAGSVHSFSSQKHRMLAPPQDDNKMSTLAESIQEHPVSKLRPKKPICVECDLTVLTACQQIASKRGDAALVVDGQGVLSGIFSDTDLVRRVVAKYLDPSNTNIMAVATRDPSTVRLDDSGLDALSMMIENHFR
jgi:CBS domain-containing protein